jgi:hypothetical protein
MELVIVMILTTNHFYQKRMIIMQIVEVYQTNAYSGYYPFDLSNVTGSITDIDKNSTLGIIQPNQLPLPKVDFETA